MFSLCMQSYGQGDSLLMRVIKELRSGETLTAVSSCSAFTTRFFLAFLHVASLRADKRKVARSVKHYTVQMNPPSYIIKVSFYVCFAA